MDKNNNHCIFGEGKPNSGYVEEGIVRLALTKQEAWAIVRSSAREDVSEDIEPLAWVAKRLLLILDDELRDSPPSFGRCQ